MTSHSPILFFIQIMVVVTSPMTVHAPPALAAMTIIPTNRSRSSRSETSLRVTEIMTMVVVRLSSTDDKKNAIHDTIHSSLAGLSARM